MLDAANVSPGLLLAWSIYALGTASPGPSNLSIMSQAVGAGRRPALVFAAGVVSGSLFWGLVAGLGLSTVVTAYAEALVAIRILGGLYLLRLAFASAHSAMARRGPAAAPSPAAVPMRAIYLRGVAMHLTNPKAVFVWLSIVALALPAAARTVDALAVVAGCAVIGSIVFFGYAMLFSTRSAQRLYASTRVWFDAALALVFGCAGLRMLTSR
jgi:threonine efflux protein